MFVPTQVKIITCYTYRVLVKVILSFIVLLFGLTIVPVFAHTTVEVEPYEIEVGWGVEPPVVGFRNNFVFNISEPGETEGVSVGVKNAFDTIEATAKFGGVTKILDINSDPRPGHYLSKVIPTKTGTYSIMLQGDINGVPIDIEVPVEDVEPTSILDFPPSGGASNQDVSSLKSALSSLQQEISIIKSGSGIEVKSEGGQAYDFAVLGLSIASAAIILAVISLIKRK